jgi:hypothetical protein
MAMDRESPALPVMDGRRGFVRILSKVGRFGRPTVMLPEDP